jgi:hypothetical protein
MTHVTPPPAQDQVIGHRIRGYVRELEVITRDISTFGDPERHVVALWYEVTAEFPHGDLTWSCPEADLPELGDELVMTMAWDR